MYPRGRSARRPYGRSRDAACERRRDRPQCAANAGYGLVGFAEELSDEQIKRQLDTNLVASIQLARAVTPHLRAQGGGRVLQMSSMGAHIAYPAFSLYHASKWAIEGFFEAYAQEVEPFGIHTTLIEPGMVATDFYGSADVAHRRSRPTPAPRERRSPTARAPSPSRTCPATRARSPRP